MSVFLLEPFAVTLIIVFSSIIVIVGLVLFYFLFYRNRALIHQIKDISRRYEYLHSLLIAQDLQYLKRIEYIAQINLLYADIYNVHKERYDHIMADQDSFATYKMESFKKAIDEKKFSLIRKEVYDFRKFINDYEEAVNKLNNDLIEVIKPEEECNRIILQLKDNYQLLKQEYNQHKNELSILKKSYDVVFKLVDNKIDDFYTYVDKADYDSATSLVPEIRQILKELEIINKAMPELCVLSYQTIPLKITELENEIKSLKTEVIPIPQAVNQKLISSFKNDAKKIINELKKFEYRGNLEKLNTILSNIESCFMSCKKERDAKAEFLQLIESVDSSVKNAEKSYIKLTHFIPKIRSIYILSDDKVNRSREIQSDIGKLSLSKRTLETYIHSLEKKPYTILLAKTKELKEQTDVIDLKMKEFNSYLASLKTIVENAYSLVSTFYYRLRKAEKILRDSDIESFKNRYKDKIDNIYSQLEEMVKVTSALPINIQKVNDLVNYLNLDADSILNSIEQENNMLKLAESSIVYINKDRQKYVELNQIISQNEKMFFDGQFEKAYNETTSVIKKYREIEKGR